MKDNNKKCTSILYNSMIPMIGIVVIAILLIISTIVINDYADRTSEESVNSIGKLYLNDIAARNVSEVKRCFDNKVSDMEKAISGLRVDYLKSEESLQSYISAIQNVNGIDMFALVDSDNKIYTDEITYEEIDRFDFLGKNITDTTISTIADIDSNPMVMVAIPVEGKRFNGKDIVACFAAMDVEKIISAIHVQGKENRVYCRLFSKEGENLLSIKGEYPDNKNLFDVYAEKAVFADGYSLNKLKDDWASGKEGYFVYDMPESGRSYTYYKPVPGTDWVLTSLMRQSVLSTQISSLNDKVFHAYMLQLIIVVAAMAAVCMLTSRIVLQNRHARHEREKAEFLKQEQRSISEKLELQTRLLAEEKLSHRHDAILNILSKDYTSVYYVDIIKNQAIPYRLSEAIRDLLGLDVEEKYDFNKIYSYYVDNAVVEEDKAEMIKYCDASVLNERFKENGVFTQVYRIKRDNKIVYAKLRAAKVDNEQELRHIVLGFAVVDKMIREEQEKTRVLRDALAQAEHASSAKTIFLSYMSHDIRTPMNAIIGYTALATTHIKDENRVFDYLKKIQSSSNHLLSLINDILDMSRIESGKVNIEEKECSLSEMMQDIKTIVQTDVRAKQLEFFVDTLEVTHENVYCDRLRLNQVLLNCISNAIKYTGNGGTVSVKINEKPSIDPESSVYEFKIKDTGIGMNEEFQKHIFEPFEREKTSTVSGIQGTGLGMAITKSIVDMMDGTIVVDSKEGVGSEFTITLKLKTAGDISDNNIHELAGVHALVVDDDFNICQSVSMMLVSIGLRSEWTMSGREAVLRAQYSEEQNDPYGVYIIDWLMPDMNGIEVVRRIRKVIGEETPNIILTAYDWTDIEEEALEAGVTSFCSKPLFLSELKGILEKSSGIPQREEEQESETETAVSQEKYGEELLGINVLLAEDNELNREIVCELLDEVGISVDTAENGKAAVEKVENSDAGTYDIILMDIQMPVMDGYEATSRIRQLKDPEKSRIPIAAMTANAFEEDRQHAFEVGMNAHIAKPVDISLLFEVIREQCLKSRKTGNDS